VVPLLVILITVNLIVNYCTWFWLRTLKPYHVIQNI